MPYQNTPHLVDETPGTKHYCTCGDSANKPYCDGSHAKLNTGKTPAKTEIAEAKRVAMDRQLAWLEARLPGISAHVVDRDMFTPVTVRRFSGHRNGSIYGSPTKQRDGTTPYTNLFISGTDQGFLGIVGSMLSGVSMANLHLLRD